jgi:hypothetical protein
VIDNSRELQDRISTFHYHEAITEISKYICFIYPLKNGAKNTKHKEPKFSCQTNGPEKSPRFFPQTSNKRQKQGQMSLSKKWFMRQNERRMKPNVHNCQELAGETNLGLVDCKGSFFFHLDGKGH